MRKAYKFARKCDITGEGMSEGWCIGGGEMYIKYLNDVRKWVKDNWDMTLEEAYEDDDDGFYWTSWEDEDEYEYESDSPDGKDATEI